MTPEQKRIEAKARELYPLSVRNFALEIKVFELAWEHGHALGESEVLNHYCDFTEVAQAALNTTTPQEE